MATNERANHKADGVIGLARETADALGRLTVQHVRLARLELRADLHAMGLQAGVIALLAAIGVVGYGLAMIGLAFLLGGGDTGGIYLVILGAAHVMAAGVGIVIARRRLRQVRLMNTTAGEMGLSLAPVGIGTSSGSGGQTEDPRVRA